MLFVQGEHLRDETLRELFASLLIGVRRQRVELGRRLILARGLKPGDGSGTAVGLSLSILITLPMLGVFLRLDRWESETPQRLLSAIAWGASFAALSSIWSQEGLQAFFDAAVGTDFTAWFRPLVITPVTEEVLKGLFLAWLLVYRRRQITGLLDGIVYGGLVGAGFAFTEQILYFGRTITTFVGGDTSDPNTIAVLVASFLLRMVMVPFMHSFLVAMFALSVAAAAGRRGSGARFGLAATGLIVPSCCTDCGTGQAWRRVIRS